MSSRPEIKGSDISKPSIRPTEESGPASKDLDTSISAADANCRDPQIPTEPDPITSITATASAEQSQDIGNIDANPAPIVIDTDPDNTDEDSTFGSDVSSFLSSLDSSAKNYIYENGRRYHGYQEGRYPVPNDEIEANREDMKHHSTKLLIGGKLFLAPITKSPQKVLDVGTGTGIWAMDFADAYPMAEVIGVDLSPMQPNMVPPNLTFEIDDVELDWCYQRDSFDFIHIRYMFGAILDWPKLLQQSMRCLKKGGWVEVVEMDIKATSDDGSLPPDNHLTQYLNLLIEAAAKSNRKLDIATDLHGLVTAAGFTDLEETAYKLPMGTWPKSRELKAIGLFHREQFLEGIQGIAMGFFTRSLGWSVQEVEVLLAKVRNDVKNPQYHTYWRTYFVYGRKP